MGRKAIKQALREKEAALKHKEDNIKELQRLLNDKNSEIKQLQDSLNSKAREPYENIKKQDQAKDEELKAMRSVLREK